MLDEEDWWWSEGVLVEAAWAALDEDVDALLGAGRNFLALEGPGVPPPPPPPPPGVPEGVRDRLEEAGPARSREKRGKTICSLKLHVN